jgi:hypothetical protein
MRLITNITVMVCVLLCDPTASGNEPSKKWRTAFQDPLTVDQQIAHILNRLTYGPTSEDASRIKTLGTKAWINEQLHPDSLLESPLLTQKLGRLATIHMSPREIVLNFKPDILADQRQAGPVEPVPESMGSDNVSRELIAAKVLRAVYGRHQLEEILTDFWFNHFNSIRSGKYTVDLSWKNGVGVMPCERRRTPLG